MINILYIHGYGSDANSSTGQEIRNNLSKGFKVFAHSFSNDYELFEAMHSNIEEACRLIDVHDIDLIVASSMGAFIAMGCVDIPKVLVNPCMLPSEQIKERIAPTITEAELNKYIDYENSFVLSDKDRLHTYGLFATNDELFSYKARFENIYVADNVYVMDGEHRISATNIKDDLVPLIERVVGGV